MTQIAQTAQTSLDPSPTPRRSTCRRTALALCLALLVAVGLVACGGDDEADIQKDLEQRGTMDLMAEIEDDEYTPPADGELTDDQIEMFAAVRERAREIRAVAQKNLESRDQDADGNEQKAGLFDTFRAMGDIGDFATADLRAAHEMGENTAEYQWVEEAVVSAYARHWAIRAQEALSTQLSSSQAALQTQLRTMLEQAETEEERETIRAQMESFEEMGQAQVAEREELTDAERHNMELVLEHEEAVRGALMEEEAAFMPGLEEWERQLGEGDGE